MLKLRTMHVSAPEAGVITTGADPRVFPAGKWLRRLKIDEIPQLVNVARGEMAFFGPRPEAPAIVANDYKPWMRETLKVRPGIVGPGSLGYFEEEAELPENARETEDYYIRVLLPRKLARDLVFVRTASTRYRAELLVRTVLGVLGLVTLTARVRAREDALAQELLYDLEQAS
jgi:lipopolysaccharide/colanic/teichoic acid biosynthesis glycosyltransferase